MKSHVSIHLYALRECKLMYKKYLHINQIVNKISKTLKRTKRMTFNQKTYSAFCITDLPYCQVYLWYPLSIITGGTTAKIMVAAKDNFLGKYIYKDTLARNLAAVIYRVSPVCNGT